jgi:hypothetical protein
LQKSKRKGDEVQNEKGLPTKNTRRNPQEEKWARLRQIK